MSVITPECLEYLHDGFYAAIRPLRLPLIPQDVFGPDFAVRVLHAALNISLHLHTLPWHRQKSQTGSRIQHLEPSIKYCKLYVSTGALNSLQKKS